MLIRETMYDKALLQRYRKALDTAVKIATVYNVQPIKGRTVIICSMDPRTQTPCSAARGLGKPRTVSLQSLTSYLPSKVEMKSCLHSKCVYFINNNDRGMPSCAYPSKRVAAFMHVCVLHKRESHRIDHFLSKTYKRPHRSSARVS